MTIAGVHDWVRHRDHDLFNVVACQGHEPTEADIAAFERECGFRLPSEFREFTMSPLGGLYVEAREEVWPVATEFEVGPFWSFLRGVKVFGIAADIPDWLDIRVQYANMREEGFGSLVPFLQVETDANKYCFNPAGAIVVWDHEDPEAQEPVDLGFGELLARELTDLEDRVRRRMRGEHT
jgi:hypothetical protein